MTERVLGVGGREGNSVVKRMKMGCEIAAPELPCRRNFARKSVWGKGVLNDLLVYSCLQRGPSDPT